MRVLLMNRKVGIDLDDTTFDFVGALADYHNEKWGTTLKKEGFSSYHFYEFFGCGKEEATKRVDEFLDSENFDGLKPLDGAIDGINRLIKMGNEIFIVTSRHRRLEERTYQQLRRHFPALVESPVYFTGNAYTGQGDGTKAEVCRREGLHYMIDDLPVYAEECAKYLNVLLLRQPWNRSVVCEGRVIELNSWHETNATAA